MSGISYQTIRSLYFNDNDIGINRFDLFVYLPLLQASVLLSSVVFFGSVEESSNVGKKRVLLVTLFCVILSMFTNGGRETILYTAILYLYTYTVCNDNVKGRLGAWLDKKHHRKILRRFILIAVAGLILMTLLRSTTGESSLSFVLRKTYYYFAGWLPNFSEHLSRVNNDQYTHGFAFVLGILRLPAAILHRLGWPETLSYTLAEKITSSLQERINIGGWHFFNAFTGVFYYFYRDFGYVSVVLESIIFGVACAVAEMRFRRQKNAKTLFWLLFMVFLIISSMVRWELVHVKTAMILYYAPFFFEKRNPVHHR